MTQHSDTDIQKGLSAEQVRQRIDAGQVNRQPNKTTKSYARIVIGNTLTFFNLINAVLALLILSVGSYRNLLFIGVIVSNTLIGIFQEIRAKRTLDRLTLISAAKATVVRDGRERQIATCELVLGDITLLGSGNQICADAVVRQGALEVDESLLTGESDAVTKNPGDALYSGSFVVSGKARAEVVHVGRDNYAERIAAQAKAHKRHPSELRDAMNRILKIVSVLIVPLGAALFLRQYFDPDTSLEQSVVGTVAAALGMIPEGLVLLTSIALAIGAIRLARKNTLVRELFCLETLARVDVLCLDKTGTLTEGRMQVREARPLLQDAPIDEIMPNLMRALPDDNATAQALRERYPAGGDYRQRGVIAFSSERKYSGAWFEDKGTYLIGAFEFLFPDGGHGDVRAEVEEYANMGMRAIVLAHTDEEPDGASLPGGLSPLALILISDIVRPDARRTLEYFAGQGVELMVISGDHPATAAHVAAEAGLEGWERYVDATALTAPESIQDAVREYRVFGRVTPEQKRQILIALKQAGHTVAMTGDGVNDVPALKEADCSIAMAQGSDAAKSCSNLVLLDSNFSAMPGIVNEGRRVINNIQSAASLFLVKTIFSILLTVLMLCLGTPYPFMPIHLTVISACAVGIPTFILSLEPNFRRIKPGFLRHVLTNALSGALTITLNVCVVTAAISLFGGSEAMRSTMCMIATGAVSLMMIERVYPLTTALRKLVFWAMVSLFGGGLIFLRDLLALSALPMGFTLLLLALVGAAPFLIRLGYRLLGKVLPLTDGN